MCRRAHIRAVCAPHFVSVKEHKDHFNVHGCSLLKTHRADAGATTDFDFCVGVAKREKQHLTLPGNV